MTLAPLWAADAPVAFHAVSAFTALILGAVQLLAAKGTTGHKVIGWGWALAMLGTILSSFFIYGFRWIGPFSPIHLLSIYALIILIYAIHKARIGQIDKHRAAMRGLYLYALVITGALTLLPGRTLHTVVFGG